MPEKMPNSSKKQYDSHQAVKHPAEKPYSSNPVIDSIRDNGVSKQNNRDNPETNYNQRKEP